MVDAAMAAALAYLVDIRWDTPQLFFVTLPLCKSFVLLV